VRLVPLHLTAQRAISDRRVAIEDNLAELNLRSVIDLEDDAHQFRAAGFGDLGLDHGVVVALLGVQVADQPLDAANRGLIDE